MTRLSLLVLFLIAPNVIFNSAYGSSCEGSPPPNRDVETVIEMARAHERIKLAESLDFRITGIEYLSHSCAWRVTLKRYSLDIANNLVSAQVSDIEETIHVQP